MNTLGAEDLGSFTDSEQQGFKGIKESEETSIKGLFLDQEKLPVAVKKEFFEGNPFLKLVETPLKVSPDSQGVVLEGGSAINAPRYFHEANRDPACNRVELLKNEKGFYSYSVIALRDKLASKSMLGLGSAEKPEIIHDPEVLIHLVCDAKVEDIETPTGYEPITKGSFVESLVIEDTSTGNCIDIRSLLPEDWKLIYGTSEKSTFMCNSIDRTLQISEIRTVSDVLLLLHEYGHAANENDFVIPENITKYLAKTQGGQFLHLLDPSEFKEFAGFVSRRERGAWAVARGLISGLKKQNVDIGINTKYLEKVVKGSLGSYANHYKEHGKRLGVVITDDFKVANSVEIK